MKYLSGLIIGTLTTLVITLPYATRHYDYLEAVCENTARQEFVIGCSLYSDDLETCKILGDNEGVAK